MSEERKKSGAWALWLAVLLAVYPLSIGPVAFIGGTGYVPKSIESGLTLAYAPLWLTGKVCPPLGRLVNDYGEACYQYGRHYHR